MKRLASTLAILSGVAALAYAGPEPFSGKEMKQVVPPPPACPSWGGFYIGGFGGYKFVNADIDFDLSGHWNDRDVTTAEFLSHVEDVGSRDLNPSGAEAGGLIGYNFQFNNWVVGVEAAGAYLWSDDSRNFDPIDDSRFFLHTSVETNYLFTFGPRLGYAVCRFLPYVTGGLAVGNLDFSQRIFIPSFISQTGRIDTAEVGWVVGGGLQYAFTDHWSVRAQYQYIDLGCDHTRSDGTANFGLSGFFADHEACLTEHNVSFAIIYKF
jgi:outer membrane immunogenic protein